MRKTSLTNEREAPLYWIRKFQNKKAKKPKQAKESHTKLLPSVCGHLSPSVFVCVCLGLRVPVCARFTHTWLHLCALACLTRLASLASLGVLGGFGKNYLKIDENRWKII